uniref:Uncharacterized protein n=1 Tax=Oryza brachyantha TaxID=4533 RepID=J3MRM9_ORYBR
MKLPSARAAIVGMEEAGVGGGSCRLKPAQASPVGGRRPGARHIRGARWRAAGRLGDGGGGGVAQREGGDESGRRRGRAARGLSGRAARCWRHSGHERRRWPLPDEREKEQARG